MGIPVGLTRLNGSERHRAAGAQMIGPAAPSETLSVTIRIRRRPGAPPLPNLSTLVAATSAKPVHLSRKAFAAGFGAATADLDRVARVARSAGLTVGETSVARRTVMVSGTVARMNHMFGVHLNRYETPVQTYHGLEGSIHVPAAIADVVEGVFGLDNRRIAKPLYRVGPLTPTALTPPQVAELYQFPAPLSAVGQTIGLLEFDSGYQQGDIDEFFGGLGLASPAPVAVGVDGASNSPGGVDDCEVVLDIDVAGSVAQGAKIVVYFAPWTEQGWIDIVTTAVHDAVNAPSVLSISWGYPEFETHEGFTWSRAAIDAVSQTFAEAAMLGVTILAASGDDGSSSGVVDGLAHCLYPASDPGVTACGGTSISDVDGASFTERTWTEHGATGGGISDVFDAPAWQADAHVPPSANPAHNVGRGMPDVAGNADFASGYRITVHGVILQVGGTSATTPLYAGLVAIMNARLGQSVGYINPTLYSSGPAVCRDIADGATNATDGAPGYIAGPGWDPCTGWGVINGTELLNLLGARSLSSDPLLRSAAPGVA